MKVICIEKGSYKLTVGKIYETLYKFKAGFDTKFLHSTNYYLIIDDKLEEELYHKSNFRILSDVREEKINKILDKT